MRGVPPQGMSIGGIALGVLSIVLLIVFYATGLNVRLMSGSSPKVLTSRLRSAAQGLCQLSALRGEGL